MATKYAGQADLHRTFAGELTAIERAVLSICEQAAETGRPLESNDDIMEALGGCGFALGAYGGGTIPGIMERLEIKGRIVRMKFQRGRQVKIVASGKATAPPKDTTPHWRFRDRSRDPPAPAIHLVRQREQNASSLIEQEARRQGKSMTDFLADLVFIGWHAYREEQEREAA